MPRAFFWPSDTVTEPVKPANEIVSTPAAPSILSSPGPPSMAFGPAEPTSTSLPEPPTMFSTPDSASLPAPEAFMVVRFTLTADTESE